MDIPEKLSTYDKEKQTKTTTQYVLDTTMCKQTQITYIRGGICYKKMEAKTNRTSFYVEIVTDITIWNSGILAILFKIILLS